MTPAAAAASNNGAAAAATKRFSHATLAEKVELMSIIKRVDPNNVSIEYPYLYNRNLLVNSRFTLPLVSRKKLENLLMIVSSFP